MKKNIILFVISSVVIATLSRLLPHPLNFAPMIGITLFSVAYLPKRWMGFVLPMACWFISDLFVNAFKENAATNGMSYFITPTALGVYVSLIIVFLLGNLLRGKVRLPKLIGVTLSSSILFYIITNSFCYTEGDLYGTGITGYFNCLMAGIPFIRTSEGVFIGSFFFNQILGDLLYVGVLFGSYYLVNRKSLKPAYA